MNGPAPPRGTAGFARVFGADSTHRASAPGRVNLIGDHTDYNGLPVLPMAIQFRIAVWFRPRNDATVRLVNADPGSEPGSFRLDQPLERGAGGHWLNYTKAAAWAVQQLVEERGGQPRGMDAWVDGDVPVAAGLSSSSALVVATGLALLEANGLVVERTDLMGRLARAERFVGTEGGGMDQAISLGGARGHAARIDFDPLTLRTVPVPQSWRFVVAHSGQRAEKSGGVQAFYNRQVRRCAEALQQLAPHWSGADCQVLQRKSGAEVTYADLLRQAELDPLGRAADVLPPELFRCFRHTLTEAERVQRAERALRTGDTQTFGALMDASHASLADDYEVSTPRLNALVDAARAAGAAGARLTGAGLGGSVVALCDAVSEVAVKRDWTALLRTWGEDPVVFTAVPSPGAHVESLEPLSASG
ncbi:MAG: galactokinase [Gemmatimonadota bacterium]